MKSHSLSLFLLKEGITEEQGIKDDFLYLFDVKEIKLSDNQEIHSKLYLEKRDPSSPWWKEYLGISDNLEQNLNGAILFITVHDRIFVFTFGNIQFCLDNKNYEYDFGLICTLNSVDENALKSTDTLCPENAVRQKTQTPKQADITLFDFDHNTSIIKNISGKVKETYSEYFSNISGTDSLHISSAKSLNDLPDLCDKILQIYKNESYKEKFPNLNNIRPIKDPCTLDKLKNILLEKIKKEDPNITLSIPEVLAYDDFSKIKFSKNKKSEVFDDIDIIYLYKHLRENYNDISYDILSNSCSLILLDDNLLIKKKYPLLKSLIYDYQGSNKESSFHLCDGCWYQVDNSYIEKLSNEIDPYFQESRLPNFKERNEGEYNKKVELTKEEIICLDKQNISPKGQTQIEPCDLVRIKDDYINFIHIKIGTRSSMLSHLFNQGVNSMLLIKTEESSQKKLKELIKEKATLKKSIHYDEAKPYKDKITFGIISSKNANDKSKALPFFSRISLKRSLQALKSMNIECEIILINDLTKK